MEYKIHHTAVLYALSSQKEVSFYEVYMYKIEKKLSTNFFINNT